MNETFAEAALLLVAHGASVNAASALPARQHAAELRRRGTFAEVQVAFVQQEPFIEDALSPIRAARVFVVPLFISDGWFSEHVIPQRLGLREPGAAEWDRIQYHSGRWIHYARPVGSHPAMNRVLRARALDVVRRHPFPRPPDPRSIALLIAGHGTPNSRGSREAIERQVEAIRREAVYAEAHGVFLEEKPGVEDAWTLTRTRNVVLVPFFISDGLHVAEQIPLLLGEPEANVRARLEAGRFPWRNPTERHGKRLWYSPAVGTEPVMVDVILERVREAAAGPRPEIRHRAA